MRLKVVYRDLSRSFLWWVWVCYKMTTQRQLFRGEFLWGYKISQNSLKPFCSRHVSIKLLHLSWPWAMVCFRGCRYAHTVLIRIRPVLYLESGEDNVYVRLLSCDGRGAGTIVAEKWVIRSCAKSFPYMDYGGDLFWGGYGLEPVWFEHVQKDHKRSIKMIKSKYEKLRPQELLLAVQNQGIRLPQPYTHHFCEPLGMLRHPWRFVLWGAPESESMMRHKIMMRLNTHKKASKRLTLHVHPGFVGLKVSWCFLFKKHVPDFVATIGTFQEYRLQFWISSGRHTQRHAHTHTIPRG